MWFWGLRWCCFCSNTQFCQWGQSDLALFIHLQEATWCFSSECCLSLCFLPWLPCNSCKMTSSLYGNLPSADVLRCASLLYWILHVQLELSVTFLVVTARQAALSTPACAPIVTMKSRPQPYHTGLLTSFTNWCWWWWWVNIGQQFLWTWI